MSRQITPKVKANTSLSATPVEQRQPMDTNDGNPNVKSNRVPLPNEVLALRSLVNAETAVLLAIRSSLAKAVDTTNAAEKRVAEARIELEAAISALSASRESTKTLERLLPSLITSIEEKKALLHPIRRLPPELLYEIFQHYVDQDEWDRRVDSDLDGRWGHVDGPLILGAVCSLWRQIVRTRSSLWQFFNFSLSRFMPKFVNHQENNPFMGRLNAWAEYSADRKVEIAIRDIGDPTDPDGLKATVMIRRIFNTVGTRTSRLQTLFTGVGAISQILGPSMTSQLPSLEQLSIHVAESVLPGIAHVPPGAFRASTSLEAIQLRNIWWEQDLALPRLEMFDIYNPDWRISPFQFLNTIANCKSIREMPIEFEHKPLAIHQRPVTVRLESLESLHTTCEWVTLAGPVLCQYMMAPKLSSLQLYGRGDIDVLAQFIDVVAPQLEHLHLGIPLAQGDEPEIDLLPVLKAAPHLIDFAVDSVTISGAFFDALAEVDKPDMIGPLISTLVFKDVMFSDPNALLRMVASRTKSGLNDTSIPRRLQIVEIQGGKNMGINSWHEQQIDEMMMRDDGKIQSEAEDNLIPSSETVSDVTANEEDQLD